MYKRLTKEFRQLLLPASVAAGAACTMPLFAWFNEPSGGDLRSFFSGLSTFAFFGGIGVAAGMAFGAEFQQRTFALLISQPLKRSRLWNEKMLALLLAVTSIGLILWLSQKFASLVTATRAAHSASEEIPRQAFLLAGGCVVATICSAPFWTLLARSTIGGIVLSAAAQFLLGLGIVFAMVKIYGPDFPFEDSITTGVIIATAIIYSAIFLWLGRWKFARLELRDASFGEGGFGTGPLAGTRFWSNWLRCRPAGMTLNLIRKELRLQKPVFMIAAVVAVCWLFTVALLLLEPARQEVFDGILNVLTVAYVAVLPLLAGYISLGEEKALGLTAWHLTLPVSARRQWLLKLAVSMSVAVLLGFALPWLLAWLSAIKTKVGLFYLMNEKDNGWSLVLSLGGLMFLMGFWAVTLLVNTLRAALASVISLVALCLAGALAIWYASVSGPFETGLLLLATAHFQLPLHFFSAVGAENKGILLVIGIVVATTLVQSLAQFRRAQTPGRILWKYSAILTALVFLLMFWSRDFANSASALSSGQSLLQQELGSALSSLPAKDPDPVPTYTKVTLQELEQTGKLSALTKAWLKNASISFFPVKLGHSDSITQTYIANIQFPNGRQSGVNCQGPPIRQRGITQQQDKTIKQTTEEKP